MLIRDAERVRNQSEGMKLRLKLLINTGRQGWRP